MVCTYGDSKESEAAILFASVQTLARNLHRFDPEQFDYVVVDEFHHAAAQSYRRIIDHFEPKFLLGLTATPNRMDGADLLALCADNLVFEYGLTEAIQNEQLSPFRYFGIADDVDYTAIPWRGGRFDPVTLTQAVETERRAQHALDVWRAQGGGRTLAFCVTTTHADFMADFFTRAGVRATAVHSGPSSEPRRESIERLRSGELQVIFTVDVFNEGLDVPQIDTVLMLRPTESPVVFLQQLGRGLRKATGKEALTALDFIGNHRSFLIKPRTLLALGTGPQPSTTRVFRAMETGEFSLPSGCSVTYDPELVDILKSVSRVGLRSALEDYCRSFADERGRRPTAVQAYEAGYNPTSVRARHGHWFGFLDDLGLLQPAESAVVQAHVALLTEIEKTEATKSYKLVTLQAMLRLGALRSGSGISELAWTAHQIVASDPRLLADTRSKEMPDPASAAPNVWRDYWVRWPLSAWAGLLRGKPGKSFRLDATRFEPTFRVGEDVGETFDAMVGEIVDFRLARYLFTKDASLRAHARLKVIQSRGRPILMLDRDRNPKLPEGETTFVSNHVVYSGNFAKIALNVARRAGQEQNELPDLLWRWFGPDAGQPGTTHYVEIVPGATHWELRPLRQMSPEAVAGAASPPVA